MATVRLQEEPFDPAVEARRSAVDPATGAVVTFTGHVRGGRDGVEALELEHYPGMTEKEMQRIAAEAERRWPLRACHVVHRHGRLLPGEAIVFVLTASAHRRAAFEAAEFLIDWLKTRAPFWKREIAASGTRWVEARAADERAAARWRQEPQK